MVSPLGTGVAQANQQFVRQSHSGRVRRGKSLCYTPSPLTPCLAPLPVRLTLLVPELIWPEPADQLALGKLAAPGLETLLARGSLTRRPRRVFENVLAREFGLDTAPFGALRLLGEGNVAARDGHWLCADPVHLRFHHERIILADASAFDVEPGEAQQLVSALNTEFADIGEFHIATAQRWYLRLKNPVDHPSAPLSAVAGRLVDSELSDKNATLTRWMNEVQMFLHGHPVNERRQNKGQPVINSLWLWGNGSLPQLAAPEPLEVWSDNPLASGLALAGGYPAHPCPAHLETLFDATQDGNHLVVLDALLPKVLCEDGEGWRSTLNTMENDWFSPLTVALGRQIKQLSLIAPTSYGELRWAAQGSDRWKFWRARRTLPSLAKELAEEKL